MSVYTVHEPPRPSGNMLADADRFVFVRDGFYGWAFLLAPLWMLRHRLWLVLLLYIVAVAILQVALVVVGASGTAQFFAALAVAILVGIEGGTLRRWTLGRRRWRNLGVVVGDDRETAERRFFASWQTAQASQPRPSYAPAAPGSRAPAPGDDIVGLFPQPGASR
jgi:Protein of unknown function (DUF2628)